MGDTRDCLFETEKKNCRHDICLTDQIFHDWIKIILKGRTLQDFLENNTDEEDEVYQEYYIKFTRHCRKIYKLKKKNIISMNT